MFAILINEKGGETKRLEFDKPEITIGRVQGNDIILPKGNVSKRHSRIVLKDGKFIIVDLKSTNGTYVNGRKITSPLVIKGTDKVYIGDFILSVEEAAGEMAAAEPPPPAPAPPVQRRSTMPPPPPVRKPMPAAPVQLPEADAGDDYGAPPDQGFDANPPEADSPMGLGPEAAAEADLPPPPAYDEPEPPAPEPPRVEPPRPEPRPRPLGANPTGPDLGRRPGPLNAPPRPAIQPAIQPTMQADAPSLPARPSPTAPSPILPRPSPIAAPARPAPLGSPAVPPPPARRSVPTPGVVPAPVAAPPPAAAPIAAPVRRMPVPTAPPVAPPPAAPAPKPAPSIVDEAGRAPVSEVMRQLGARLAAQLDIDGLTREQLSDPQLVARAEGAVAEMIEGVAADGALPSVDRDALAKDVVAETLGLGPIEELLGEEGVREIAVPRHDRIFVDREGQFALADRWFSSPEALARVIDRLAGGSAPVGGLIETRLADGTLVTAAVPPLAHGATLTLRRPHRGGHDLADLVARGSLSQPMADFLALTIAERRNVLVCGGPGSGRSTLIGALCGAAADGERVVSVEEAEELQLRHGHWVQLSTRGGDAREAIHAALRLRPERLVVGDLRGGEALLVLEAAAGLGGVVAGLYGASAADGLARFTALAELGSPGDGRPVRDAVGRQVHVVVTTTRGSDGRRRVAQISEVTGTDQLADVFLARADGSFAATGYVPTFAGAAPSAMFRA